MSLELETGPVIIKENATVFIVKNQSYIQFKEPVLK